MISYIPLSLSTKKKKKKCNLQILRGTFCKYIFFKNFKNRNGLPTNYSFLFLVF